MRALVKGHADELACVHVWSAAACIAARLAGAQSLRLDDHDSSALVSLQSSHGSRAQVQRCSVSARCFDANRWLSMQGRSGKLVAAELKSAHLSLLLDAGHDLISGLGRRCLDFLQQFLGDGVFCIKSVESEERATNK